MINNHKKNETQDIKEKMIEFVVVCVLNLVFVLLITQCIIILIIELINYYYYYYYTCCSIIYYTSLNTKR